ncbi:MAG TPA: NAD(P)H-dependent glycerol-3-phosphate dehydrogenase [Clostridia bacterium]|nr:NAD(P)H-dependent glycerol-3-phosphate dehydrogenase [Clostridia bacterium]
MPVNIAVLGAGSWGTALGIHLALKELPVTLWSRSPERALKMRSERMNRQYLPDILFPELLDITSDLSGAVKNASVVVLAVPSQAVRSLSQACFPLLSPETIVVNTAKGFEEQTLLRLTQVMASEAPDSLQERLVVLSGPSHAEEVARRLPTTVVIAAKHKEIAEQIQDLLMDSVLRVYTNPDVIGVELGGALKNVIALATGIADGLGFGDNTRAALMTRGLAEIARLGIKMGAEVSTFAGLTGIGDLIVTCNSMHSRNRRAGIQLGKGVPLTRVLADMGMVVEGITTTKTAFFLSRKFQVPMPIAEEIYQVLYHGKEPLASVRHLMERRKTHEIEEVVLRNGW